MISADVRDNAAKIHSHLKGLRGLTTPQRYQMGDVTYDAQNDHCKFSVNDSKVVVLRDRVALVNAHGATTIHVMWSSATTLENVFDLLTRLLP